VRSNPYLHLMMHCVHTKLSFSVNANVTFLVNVIIRGAYKHIFYVLKLRGFYTNDIIYVRVYIIYTILVKRKQ